MSTKRKEALEEFTKIAEELLAHLRSNPTLTEQMQANDIGWVARLDRIDLCLSGPLSNEEAKEVMEELLKAREEALEQLEDVLKQLENVNEIKDQLVALGYQERDLAPLKGIRMWTKPRPSPAPDGGVHDH